MIAQQRPTPIYVPDATPTAKPLSVTVNAAAALTGLGISTIWKLIAEKRLQTTSVGRRRLVRYESIERLLQGDAA